MLIVTIIIEWAHLHVLIFTTAYKSAFADCLCKFQVSIGALELKLFHWDSFSPLDRGPFQIGHISHGSPGIVGLIC